MKKEKECITQLLPIPKVLCEIVCAYYAPDSLIWTERSHMKDASWFNSPCYDSLVYLSSDRLAAGTNNGDIEIFDLLAKKRVHRTPTTWLSEDPVESLVHDEVERKMIAGGRLGSITVWNSSTYEHLRTFKEHKGC